MKFSKGQVVIHPHHGPATVGKISTRVIKKESKEYLKLEVHHPPLSVAMPAERAESIGVRATIDVAEVREIFELMVGPGEVAEKVWARRMKHNTSRLRTGEVRIIAGLIRDLIRQNEQRRLSLGERDLLREASRPFLAELALVLSMTEEEAEAMINAAVLEGTKPTLPEGALAAAS